MGTEGEAAGAPPSIFSQCHRPLTLKFEDVEYKIKIRGNGVAGSKSAKSSSLAGAEKRILKGVSGAVRPAEMLAMLGPSGSGKTTLLTALGGRLGGGKIAGDITYNGRPFAACLKRSMGFVTQDDILYPHLTVNETLLYTALLRLPRSLSREQKEEHVEAVMKQLGLIRCRNSIIGSGLVRGVSGGERKRVSIGQEMLINPSLLFLDEPTSGLDSTTAQRIVSTLRELAVAGGRTVVMTIHQPSSSLFYMFHKVLLLADGSQLYYGKGSEAMEYLAGVGYSPYVPMNPADFLLDLANGVFPGDDQESQASDVKEALFSAYRIHLHEKVKAELSEIDEQFRGAVELDNKKVMRNQWSTTWWEQFTVLLERGLKERKHEAFSPLKIAQVMIVAPLSGCLWWHSSGKVQDQVGLLFFVVGFWGFFPLFQAIFTFPQERLMLTKERSSGMYRLSSYFVSRIIGDLPMELVLPTVFVTIVYWMGGLKATAAAYFACLFVMLLAVLVAQGLGLALGALVMDLKAATTLGSVIMLTYMLAGGYYVQSVPAFISWIKYISISFYSFKLLISSQYSPEETYQCPAAGITCHVRDFPAIKATGFDHTVLALVALLLMFFFYRLVAYLALMRIGVTK